MTNTPKRVIQRNLPLNRKYKIIACNYSSIEEGGSICENCDRVIANIAHIQDDTGKHYHVGLDCASTLSGIQNTLDLSYNEAQFQAAKQARAKVLKLIKNNYTNLSLSTMITDKNFFKERGAGGWQMIPSNWPRSPMAWQNYSKDQWINFIFPVLKDLIKES